MSGPQQFLIIFLLTSLAIFAGLAFLTWRRRAASGGAVLALLLALLAAWSLTYSLEGYSASFNGKLFWFNLQFVWLIFIPPTWFIFILQYVRQQQWLRRLAVPLVVEAAGQLLLLLTSGSHRLLWSELYLEPSSSFLAFVRGPGHAVHTGYLYLLVLLAALLSTQAFIRFPRLFPTNTASYAVFGALTPWVLTIFAFVAAPSPVIKFAYFAYSLSALILAWGFFRFQPADILPAVYSLVFGSMDDAVIVLDERSRIVDLNPAGQRLLGRPAAELLGQSIDQVVAGQPEMLERYGQVKKIRTEIFVGDNYFDLHISPLYDQGGQLSGRVVVLRNVTERKRMETITQAALVRTGALYQVVQSLIGYENLPHLLQTLADTVASALPADRVTLITVDFAQKQVTHFIKGGPGFENVAYVSFEELMNGLAGWVLRELQPALSPKSEPDPRESLEVQRRRIETNCGAVLVVPVQYQGQLLGVLTGINRPDQPDFTLGDADLMLAMGNLAAMAIENVRLYEKEQQHLREVQATNEELNAYAYTVAHDLKNPLLAISGYAELLQLNGQDEAQQQYLRKIYQHALKMNEIIDALLLLARVRQQEVDVAPLLMDRVVSNAIQSLEALCAEHNPQITRPDDWPLALGYSPWVEQVWVNYLSNAIKYGGRPPVLELGASLQPEGQQLYFWLRDNGPGLSAEEQARVFEPFERLGQQGTRGHGLGLTIVRRIVENLGGQVGVESDGVQGSTFWFTLPATRNNEEE
ncbi:MAG: ATP-binding protein [Chloroflexi bacterium]|nr:ATP-binding protein [Chloroflexota bacterium]MCI0580653.1 ATP-binding protein [Chloroflexota bacterium]MCI0648669.1 ATP-binding protein [Chloroflexota bacterium]MCI0728077.1 ATP-binding protein [Chloroflexota bacterium]